MTSFQNLLRSLPTFSVDPQYITAPMPKVLWIELTSKCPFDCIFCTRKVRFGAGQNLDFEIYKRLIAELEAPDFIGLNYSGESIYYPRLLEAISLANATGAATELVTAFSTISKPLLRGIIESGLDRLAISLHAMDPQKYKEIYQFGTVELLKQRIDDLMELKAALGLQKPRVDFCFVAMERNLDQLLPVAEYAKQVGVPEIFIHPIIGRHLVPHDFSAELSANMLREGFKGSLRKAIERVRNTLPDLPIEVLNPDLDPNPQLSHVPAYYAPRLPEKARIHSCDQSPFESVHILAGGDVVVCEVHDEVSLGNLRDRTLRDIWQGEAYRDFRQKYVSIPDPKCRDCVWKLAYVPGEWRSTITAADGLSPQFLRGWHAHEGSNIIWSKKQAVLALRNHPAGKHVRIAGVLPKSSDGQNNEITVTCNHVPAGEIRNDSGADLGFDAKLPLPDASEYLYMEFVTRTLFRPSLHGSSNDSRDLGFALTRIEVCP